jgi:hypothetical protein
MDLLIVASVTERTEALNKGWDQKDIIFPQIQKMEGRRFSNAYLTWSVLWSFVEGNDHFLELLHRSAIFGNAAVHVVGPIPDVQTKGK